MEYQNDTGFLDISDFVYIKSNSLEESLCEDIIDKFEEDDRKKKGVIGKNTLDTVAKQCLDLRISDLDSWKDIDEKLCQSLRVGISEYLKFILDKGKGLGFFPYDEYSDDGYIISKYDKDGYYTWHNDYHVSCVKGTSCLSYIWCLNTLKRDGQIQFIDGTKFRSEVGNLIIFPASWNVSYRFLKVKNNPKYIISGYFYQQGNPNVYSSQTGTTPKKSS
tara:strand:- start:8 stop:664 length:657 start_codon:yes stop_codon:yes gene_type:complete